MPPKQVKKTTDKPVQSTEDILTIQKKWAENVKEIISMREKLTLLEKQNDEYISKLWELMNKNPSNDIIVEGSADKPINEDKPQTAEEKPKAKPKVVKKKEETDEPEEKPVAKVVKKKEDASEKPSSKVVKKKEDTDDEHEDKPEPKVTPKVVKKKVEKPEIEKPVKKTGKEEKKPESVVSAPTKGKITAPSKGTPKPKANNSDDENPRPVIDDSSSEDTDIDSLSSVSSESEASGGEDD